jgi:hypothetical protein
MTTSTWTDEDAFLVADARRRRSDAVVLGSTWRSGDTDTWTLTWLRATGELYRVRNDSLVGGSEVVVLAVLATETELDARLEGWDETRWGEMGLEWLDARLRVTAVA